MRRTFTRKYGMYLLGLLLVSSCDFSSLDDPIIIPEVEDEFTVDLWEALGATAEARQLVVKIESIKTEKCLNYSLDHRFAKEGNRLKVALNNIIKPQDCVAGEATVKADVGAGFLTNGIYSFHIDLKNTVFNEGQLTVLSDSYNLQMQSEDGISLRREELLRVPEGAVWGYVQYAQAADEALATKWVDDLGKISQNPTWYRSGYYGHFTITNNNRQVTVHAQPTTANLKTFLYQYTEEASKVKNLLQTYRQTYGNRLIIKLYNAKGEVL